MEDSKTTNRKAIETVLGWLADRGVTVTDTEFGNGYYLFDFGEDSVCHFKVKGARRWLFGIWCVEDDGKPGSYRVSVFGEHRDYIDKFKPTATSVSAEFTLGPSDISDGQYPPCGAYKAIDEIKFISAHPSLMKYTHYGSPRQGVLGFLLEEFWYYRIRKNLDGFFEKRMAYWFLKFAAAMYTLRFRRRGNSFKATVRREDYWYPKYTLKVVYGNMDDEETERVYSAIHGGTAETRRPWLIPNRVDDISRVMDCESEDDTRGFRYKPKDEDEGNEGGDANM